MHLAFGIEYVQLVMNPGTKAPYSIGGYLVLNSGITENYTTTVGSLLRTVRYDVQGIVDPAFKGNRITGLETDIPQICNEAFRECPNLTSVTLTDNAYIGDKAFYNCPSLKTFTVKKGDDAELTPTWGNYIFGDMTLLTTLSIDLASPPVVDAEQTFSGL